MKLLELHAIIRGKVQGVGFRYLAKALAENFKLNGTVKNLSDGTVEIYVQGEKTALDAFVENLKQLNPPVKVNSIQANFYLSDRSFNEFKIL